MNAPTGLRELLDQALVRLDVRSGRRLSEIAQDAGYRVSHATINQIRSGSYSSRPSDDTVRAIAWLAGVSDETAFAAADLPVPGPPFADELPPGVDALSPRKRKAVLDLLRVLIDDEERDGHDRDAAPNQQAVGSTAAEQEWRTRVGKAIRAAQSEQGDDLNVPGVGPAAIAHAMYGDPRVQVDDVLKVALYLGIPEDIVGRYSYQGEPVTLTEADGVATAPRALPDDGTAKHWTSATEQDIRAGGSLPQAPAHGRTRRTSDRTKKPHS